MAQPPGDLQVEAWFSAGTNIHPDRFLPITVQLDNRGGEQNLSLTFRLGQRDVIDPVLVKVPAGAKQQFQIGVPRFEGYQNEMDLIVRRNGSQVAETTIKFQTISDGLAVTLLVPAGQSAFAYLQGYNDLLSANSGGNNNAQIQTSTPPLHGLPTHWSGYLGADMVVLYDLPRLSLTQPQIQAVADWTRAGGTLALVSSGDPAEYRGTALEELAPLVASGSRDEPGFPMVTGELRPGAKSLHQVSGFPTLVEMRADGGTVYQITLPLLKDNILDNPQSYWKAAIATAEDGIARTNTLGMRADNLLRKLDEMLLPNPGLLAWLLLAYVLLVGPVNFAILKKRDRMLWIFVTVPVMALAFTGGMFLTTQLAHGTDILTREVSRLRLDSGRARGVMDSQLSLFTPFPSRIQARCPRATTALVEPPNGPPEAQPAVRMTEELTYPDIKMQMASMRRFSARAVPELEGPISLKILGKSGTKVELEVDNQSGAPLQRCCLVVGDRTSEKFTADEGKKRHTLQLGTSDDRGVALALLGDEDDGRNKDRVDMLTRELTAAHDNKGATLLGWSEKLTCGVEFSGRPRRIVDCLVEVRTK